jgi:hypothetical protein
MEVDDSAIIPSRSGVHTLAAAPTVDDPLQQISHAALNSSQCIYMHGGDVQLCPG